MMIFYLLAFITALLFSAYFSGTETGFIRADPEKIADNTERGYGVTFLKKILRDKDELLSMTLIGNNLSVIIASTVATSYLINTFHLHEEGTLIVTLIVTPLLLFFGEILPKTLFLQNPLGKLTALTPLILITRFLFYPFIRVITFFTDTVVKLLIPEKIRIRNRLSRDDLKNLLHYIKVNSDVEKREQLYLSRLLSFYETQVREILRPLVDITAVPDSITIRELASLIQETGFTRIPVFHDSIDRIVGIIHAKDILFLGKNKDLDAPLPHSLLRPVIYIPETNHLGSILSLFQDQHVYSAIVINEFGSVEGIISIEDVMEEIFGEIQDEFDTEYDDLLYPLGQNVFIVSGRYEIDSFNNHFHCTIPKHQYETIAGFLLYLAGDIPPVGTTIKYRKFSFHIIKADNRKIEKIRLEILSP